MDKRKTKNVQKKKPLHRKQRIYEKAGIKCFKCVKTSRTTISTRPVDKTIQY